MCPDRVVDDLDIDDVPRKVTKFALAAHPDLKVLPESRNQGRSAVPIGRTGRSLLAAPIDRESNDPNEFRHGSP